MTFRPFAALAACAILTASCSRETKVPVAPDSAIAVVTNAMSSTLPTVYTSGVSPATTYDPIFPAAADLTWETTSCTTVPAVGLTANWQNPHAAYVLGGHPWTASLFTAGWINAWNYLASEGPAGQSWTKYTTPISGTGPYVLQLLADNCSWVYIDNQLAGVQPAAWNDTNTKYSLTLTGSHTLSFIIFDGGGAAGGKFRLETFSSYLANGGDATKVSLPPTVTTVTFGPGPFLYTGSAYTATATVSTGDAATIVYTGNCVNAGGTCTATATYAGDETNGPSSATATITIGKLASTTTVGFGAGPFMYTGSAFTATSTVTPSGTATIVYSGDCTNAGTSCTATATYAGDATHAGSSATASITIAKAPSTTTVGFGSGPFVYTGSPFTATAAVTPSGSATIAYTGDCTNAGSSCTATATFAGDINHAGSSATASLTIAKATSSTSVGFGAGPFVYRGSAFTATASVNPSGSAPIAYSGDCTNAGSSCTATATFAGDANHSGSAATANITIAKAASNTTVSFGAGPFVYTGSPFIATATVTPSGSATIAYAGDCVSGGITCSATASYLGDANHSGSSARASILITYGVCTTSGDDDREEKSKGDDRSEKSKGDDRSEKSKGVESGSTLPVKLRVCNAQGRSIGSRTLIVKAVGVSPTGTLNDSGKANPGNLFRLDDDTYMFNLSTKGFAAGNYTLDYTIGNDPTVYHYAFSVRAK
jgi:hypothetical protein